MSVTSYRGIKIRSKKVPDPSYVCDSDGYGRFPGYKAAKVPLVTEFRSQNFNWPFDTIEEAKESIDNILNGMIKHIPCNEKEAVRIFLLPDSVSPECPNGQELLGL